VSTESKPEEGPWAEAYVSENGETLLIKVKVSVLQDAMRMNPSDDSYAHYRVTDATAFAVDVANWLNAEDEQGTTLVHQMLDQGIAAAIDNGSEHVEEGERAEPGEEDSDVE
jgi:hypothetical protein